jgi:hypothetical protein
MSTAPFRRLAAAALALLALVPGARAFNVFQQVECLERPLLKPDNTPVAAGEVTIRVGFFKYDLANLANNNAQIVANAANLASLNANFETFWTFTGSEGDNGTAGVNGELGANAGGAGLFYTYFLSNETAVLPGGTFALFADKPMYCWVQRVGAPDVQAIFTDSRPRRFAGGTDPLTDANAVLALQPTGPFLQVLLGENTAAGFRLVQAATTATLAFSAASSSVVENAGTATLTVNRTGKTDSSVTVQYATGDLSAVAGTDYTATSGTLTFGPNVLSQILTVPIADRAGFQPSRSFTVTLSNPGTGAELGSPAVHTVTITDDDPPMPGQLVLSSATYSVSEGGGSVAITVRRIGGSDLAVGTTLSTTNGTATAGSDYTALNTPVTFADGNATDQVFNIPILEDTAFEGNEVFTVALSNPTGGATLGTPSSATITILENDEPPTAGTLSFTSATYTVAENGGSVTITVQRTLGAAGTVGASYATSNGTASAPGDYTTTSGTLAWGDGDTASKSFTVPILDNVNDEPDKTFTVTLSNPTGGVALAAPATATITIQDDDTAGTLAWSVASSNVAENAGPAVLTLTRTGGSDGPVSATVNTANGTAQAGTDYTAVVNQVVNLPHGVTSATVNVGITNNATFQGDRTFTATLSAPTGGATLGTPTVQTVTIVEDETALPGALAFSASNYTVDEASGTATITVVRTGGSDTTVTVQYAATAGTANAGDFTETMGTLSFAQGELSKSFTVAITNDTLAEPDETVLLALSNPTNGATLGTPSTATLTIISDDARPTVRLNANAFTGLEGQTVNVVVQRSGGLDQGLSVDYTTVDGTAKFGADYARARGTLTFDPGVTSQTVPILLKDDTVPEGDEKFKFTLSNPRATSGGALGPALGEPSTATITIARSDAIDQPDNAVATLPYGRFAGKDVYNATGNGQVASKYVKPGSHAEFKLRVANNGNLPDTFRVNAVNSGTANGANVRYFFYGSEVTARIKSPDGFVLPKLTPGKSVEIVVRVIFRGGLADTGYGATLTTTSLNTPTAVDVARVVAIVRD